MSAITTPRSNTWALFAGVVLFIVSAFAGLLTAFLSQAASPNYRHLFWFILPFFLVHLVTVALYFFLVRHWSRLILGIITVLAVCGVSECAFRVFTP
jgi:hypothetical protein